MDVHNEKILITGIAGFIGYHVCKRLLNDGFDVVGIDNYNDYYDPEIKRKRSQELVLLSKTSGAGDLTIYDLDISDRLGLDKIFLGHNITKVINLAAQAGVRYSIENPQAYIDTNVTGFQCILDVCRENNVNHLIYASSSSVYGDNKEIPFSSKNMASHPVSIYAATKRMNEMMAHVYAHQYGLPCTGLRFFTVYGPSGRPDMAPMKFANAIMNDETIDVYNNGDHYRDFTYIDDIVEGVIKVSNVTPMKGEYENSAPDRAVAPYRVYNIGAQTPVHLMSFIESMEKHLGKKANKRFLPMQPGDVYKTYADVSNLVKDTGYSPSTSMDDGVKKFADWFLSKD